MTRRAKLELGSEIFLTYLTTRWYLRHGALPSVVARLRGIKPGRLHRSVGAEQGARLGRAVGRTLSVLPADSRCLVRSLVLLRLLARRGEAADLVIAARPGEAEGFDAHAWVEIGGQPLLPPAESPYARLVTL